MVRDQKRFSETKKIFNHEEKLERKTNTIFLHIYDIVLYSITNTVSRSSNENAIAKSITPARVERSGARPCGKHKHVLISKIKLHQPVHPIPSL